MRDWPHLPWKLLSTSICPGTLQTVLSEMGVASGYCTLKLFFLQREQMLLTPLAPCEALPACTSGGHIPVQRLLHVLRKHGEREGCYILLGIWGIPKPPVWTFLACRARRIHNAFLWPSFQFSEWISISWPPGSPAVPLHVSKNTKAVLFSMGGEGSHGGPKGAATLQALGNSGVFSGW